MDPKTIGSFFWYTYDYGFKGAPLVNLKGTTNEVDELLRYGRCWLLRVPFTTHALVLGRWDGRFQNEDEAIVLAMGGRPVAASSEEIRTWD